MRLLPLLCLPVPALLLFAGCGEPCDPDVDEAYCDGNTVVYCPQPGPDQLFGANRWAARACLEEQVCVEPENLGVFCALDDVPDPLCAEGRVAACEDAVTRLWCSRGYATGRQDCLSCTEEGRLAACEGGFGHDCGGDHECASGTCNEQGHCL